MLRVVIAMLLVTSAELMQWHWLRFATSEAVLRALTWLALPAERVSFDTITVQQELFRFVVPCTFVDVIAGSFPFLWKVRESLFQNLLRLVTAAGALLIFNSVRLVVGQILYSRGVP